MTKETYLHSVDTLLDAYNSGELQHGNCSKCAVGNLLGTDVWKTHGMTSSSNTKWTCTYGIEEKLQKRLSSSYYEYLTKEEQKEIDEVINEVYQSKGVTRQEVQDIEYAFESAKNNMLKEYYYEYPTEKTLQYVGLCAVLIVMEKMVEEPVNSKDSMSRLQVIAHEKYHVTV